MGAAMPDNPPTGSTLAPRIAVGLLAAGIIAAAAFGLEVTPSIAEDAKPGSVSV
jgi:hypothetical protein